MSHLQSQRDTPIVTSPCISPIKPITRTPRTDEECGVLLSERPPLWEFYYTSFLIVRAVQARKSRVRDITSGFFTPGDFVETEEALQRGVEEMSRLLGITRSFEGLLSSPLQTEAWGEPGEPGDMEAIEHVADRYGKLVDMLSEWCERVGGYSTISDEATGYFSALLRYADQPISAITNFPNSFREQVDSFHEITSTGENIHLEIPIAWEVPREISEAYETAQKRLIESF